MKIRIHDGDVAIDDRLRAHLERRLDFALSAFGDQVEMVFVRLSAESTRASPLKRCEIEVKMVPRSVRVAETGTDAFLAVANAASRLRRSVARALARDRAWVNGQPATKETPLEGSVLKIILPKRASPKGKLPKSKGVNGKPANGKLAV